MFDDKQVAILNQELDSNRVRTRSKGNISLSYLEGFDILESANRVFGFGNWDYNISKLESVSSEFNQNQNHIICYKAIVQVKVYNQEHTKDISREDVGFGTGIARTLADAHEGGAKEAVTDAIKRTLRSFGNQFGNSLYDKSKKHNNTNQTNNQQSYQQPLQNNQAPQNQAQTYTQNNQSQPQQEYAQLINMGLNIVERGNTLIVVGDDIFSKKDTIKSCGFRWDGDNKQWYKSQEQRAA